MKTKLLLTLGLAAVVAFGIQVGSAQSQDPASPAQELPHLDDIPWCSDVDRYHSLGICKGGPEHFHGHWFVGSDK